MQTFKQIEIFNDRYPWLGPAFWMVSLQYFIVMLAAALAWATPYSIIQNTISDLGNTACGVYGGRYVCSPLHMLMNVSFVLLGLTMIAGSSLIYHEFSKSLGSKIGFGFMALAGLGTIMVGLFPENTISILHYTGAALPFLIGNIGILLLGITLDLPVGFRIYTIITAAITLTALLLFITHNYLGLGQGGMERLTSYPQTLWLIALGVYMSRNRFKKVSDKMLQQLQKPIKMLL